jgi:hypothetical protein
LIEQKAAPLERCSLRPGNVHSADGWRVVLEPVIARFRQRMRCRYFRADAAFANPEVYDLLEAESYKYIIRLPANSVLQERIGWMLKRPAGHPPQEVRLVDGCLFKAWRARSLAHREQVHPVNGPAWEPPKC